MCISVHSYVRLAWASGHLIAFDQRFAQLSGSCLCPVVRNMPAESVMGAGLRGAVGTVLKLAVEPGCLRFPLAQLLLVLSLVCKAPRPDTVQRRQPIQHLRFGPLPLSCADISSGALAADNIGRHHGPRVGVRKFRRFGSGRNASIGKRFPAFSS